MRLLVADGVDIQPLEELRVLGIEVVSDPKLTRDSLPGALAGVGILVVRRLEVTAAAIDSGRELNLIVRAGGGTANIDIEAASARGIYVAHCPGKNAAAVAELTMGMVLALDRLILDAHNDMVGGRWERTRYANEAGLLGRHIGVAGLGAVGREVVARAQAFGMKAHAYSRGLSSAKAQRLEITQASSLERLAAKSDVLTVHLPLSRETKGVISRAVLEALPRGAIVVNTSRAELFDLDALEEIAAKKELRLGFDVHPDEPREGSADYRSRLAKLPHVVLTPHIAGGTKQAQRAIGEEVCRVVRSFLTEENVPNVVNVCSASPARYVVVLRQLDKIGALANTLSVLKRHGINIEEISNTVFDGAKATCTKLRVSGRPSDACLKEIVAFGETLHVDVIAMPNLA
ncbi:MAG: NAD(P)-dependent oxidoreductase [Polyangiaceae bacterium]